MWWWSAAWATIPCAPSEPQACVEAGEAALQQGRRGLARRRLREACTPEHPQWCTPLLGVFGEGHAVLERAEELCDQGDGTVCLRLGQFYGVKGPENQLDRALAVDHYYAACGRQIGQGCANAAWSYARGNGVELDPALSTTLLQAGCDVGHTTSCLRLSVRLAQGAGIQRDIAGGLQILETTCADGSKQACLLLGTWLVQGRGVDADPVQGMAAWTRSCLKGEDDACILAASRLSREGGDPGRLVEILDRSCDSLRPGACGAALLLEGAVPIRLTEHAARFDGASEAACRAGHGPSCLRVAETAVPQVQAQLRLEADRLEALAADGDHTLDVVQLGGALPAAEPVRVCLTRTLPQLASPVYGGRGALSPGLLLAADWIEADLASMSLSTSRQDVAVPAHTFLSPWIEVQGRRFAVDPMPGSAAGPIVGPVRVLSEPPTAEDLEALGGAVAVLFPKGTGETTLSSPVPLLGVSRAALEAARGGGEVLGAVAPEGSTPTSPNLIAVLPGRGDLAEEVVVMGAHYDSQGSNLEGVRWPGADDNASGVGGLLCGARATIAALEGESSHRTVAFVAFTAEELGLYGSLAFLEHPPVVGTMTAMINLDMIGRVRDGRLLLRSYGQGWHDPVADLARQSGLVAVEERRSVGASDHLNFALAGVPAVYLSSGQHGDYHQPTDVVAKLDLDGAVAITRVAAGLLHHFATDRDVRMPVEDSCTEAKREPLGFGIDPSVWRVDRGHVRCVPTGSVASTLGIEPGDIVFRERGQFGDWPTEPVEIRLQRGDVCFVTRAGDPLEPVDCTP